MSRDLKRRLGWLGGPWVLWLLVGLLGTMGDVQGVIVVRSVFQVDRNIADFTGPNTVGVADLRSVSLHDQTATISDLSVGLNITGRVGSGFNGDIYAQLSHVLPGDTDAGFAVLLNRPGVTEANAFGYSDNGIDIKLTTSASDTVNRYRDAAGFNLATSRNTSGQLVGEWQPTTSTLGLPPGTGIGSLSSFDSVSPNGQWVLLVRDRSAGGLHTLKEWYLEYTLNPGDGAVLDLVNERIRANAADRVINNSIRLMGQGRTAEVEGDQDLTLNGVIEGQGGLAKSGTGNLHLGGVNTFSGGVELRGGTLTVDDAQALGSGEIQLAGGTLADRQGDALTLNNSVQVTGSSAIEVGNARRVMLQGVVTGSETLQKTGNGRLDLEADSPGFSGSLDIAGGEAHVGGDFSGASAVVRPGARLSGDGSVGNLTLEGGQLAPGASPGTLTVNGDLLLQHSGGQNAAYDWEINKNDGTQGSNPGWDWVHVTGKVTLDGSIDENSPYTVFANSLEGFTPDVSATWTILTADQGIFDSDASPDSLNLAFFGLDTSSFSASGGSLALEIGGNNTSLNLVFTAVPEPHVTAVFSGICLAAFAVIRRRRRA